MPADAVYLDDNATAPLRPEARAAMALLLDTVGNASSVHGFGRAARRAVETAREQVAALVGARPAQVIFTASGTEANNLALRGFPGRPLLVSAVEHESVLRCAPVEARLPVTAAGLVDRDALAARLRALPAPGLVSVMLANNETGVIQPVAELAALAHAHGALVHCDAVQAPGRIALDLAALGVDLLTISSHKLGGPMGVAALIAGTDPAPLLVGGGQERGRRAGTENVAALAGFGAAAAAAAAGLTATAARLAGLRDGLEAQLRGASDRLVVVGAGTRRLPNTSCLALPGVKAETQVMALDLAGYAVSAGSACSSGKVAASHVLAAMGLPAPVAGGAIRVSLGWHSSAADIAGFATAWAAMAARLAPLDRSGGSH